MKLKRTFCFKKLRNNIICLDNNSYEYTTLKDSVLLNYMIAAAARYNVSISAFKVSEYTDDGYVTVIGYKKDFILFVADVLSQFSDSLVNCQI